MKQLLQQFAAYNIWANARIIESVEGLPAELIEKPVESSFNSLRLTVLHLWDTESAWWQRVHLSENVISHITNPTLSIESICSNWKQQSLKWEEWIRNAKDINLNHVFAYRNSKKEEFKQPVYEVLLHLFNHATYHRGQFVTILHQLGIEKKPHTDFILFTRNKK